MAKTPVAKNSGILAMGAIQGRDPTSGKVMDAAKVSLSANGLSPVITQYMVHANPTSMNVVAIADNGTNTLSVRMTPSGRSGRARPRIQVRMEKCHSGDVWLSATYNCI